MENRKKFSRKDFLKLGGLAAISLPTMTKVGQLGADSLVRSEEAYGGFRVRQLG